MPKSLNLSPEQKFERKKQKLREWRAKNAERNKQWQREWYAKNKEKMTDYFRKWREENRETLQEQARQRYWSDPVNAREKLKEKRKANPEKHFAAVRRARKKVLSTLKGRVAKRMRWAVKQSLKLACDRKYKRGTKWEMAVGYTVEDLIAHLEAQFTKGMTREKLHSGEIHIDHIKPLMLFSFECMEDSGFKDCWALRNLRPMWAQNNISRGAFHRWERVKHGKLVTA